MEPRTQVAGVRGNLFKDPQQRKVHEAEVAKIIGAVKRSRGTFVAGGFHDGSQEALGTRWAG